MSESIFFNSWQSISSSFDFDEAYTAAKIYRHKAAKPLLIVQEKDGQPYYVFDESQAVKEENAKAKEFAVLKRITD